MTTTYIGARNGRACADLLDPGQRAKLRVEVVVEPNHGIRRRIRGQRQRELDGKGIPPAGSKIDSAQVGNRPNDCGDTRNQYEGDGNLDDDERRAEARRKRIGGDPGGAKRLANAQRNDSIEGLLA